MGTLLVLALVGQSAPSPAAIESDRQGKAHYVAGRHAQAAAQFLKAWRATPRAKYLFNRAKALEAAGGAANVARAYVCYLGYLHANPGAKDRSTVELHLAEIVAKVPQGAGVVRFDAKGLVGSLTLDIEPTVPIDGPPIVVLLPLGKARVRVGSGPGGRPHRFDVVGGPLQVVSLAGGGAAGRRFSPLDDMDSVAGTRRGAPSLAPASFGPTAAAQEPPGADAVFTAPWLLAAGGGALVLTAVAAFALRPANACPGGYERGVGLAGDACYRDLGAQGIEHSPKSDPSRVPEVMLGGLGAVALGAGLLWGTTF